MTIPHDLFPQPTRTAAAHDGYATPPTVGGIRQPPWEQLAAAMLPRKIRPGVEHVNEQKTAALQRAISQSTPRPVRLHGQGIMPASGALYIGVSGPEAGFQWDVRRVNVGPLDYSTATLFPTGALIILAITEKGLIAPDSGYEVVSTTTSFPAEGTWGRDELQLQGSDKLRLIITGLTPGTQVTVGGQAYEVATGVEETYSL